MGKNFIFLSGLPRTGSTLLSAILSQNKDIHAPGNSPVCQLMWDMHVSCHNSASEQIRANNRTDAIDDLIRSIPETYYKHTQKNFVVDKCRSWTLPVNLDLIQKHVTKNPKILVLLRPIDEILVSMAQLRKKNGWKGDLFTGLLDEGSEPIMRSLAGVINAKSLDTNWFHFVNYKDIVYDPSTTMNGIYDFLKLPRFEHDFESITQEYPENDFVYGMLGQHDIRPTLSELEKTVKLPKNLVKKCHVINQSIFEDYGSLRAA